MIAKSAHSEHARSLVRAIGGDGPQGLLSANTMGQSEQLAQRTFAEETERTTAGAAGWQDPPEIRLDKVTGDGYLVIRRPHGLAHLPAPWPLAQPHGEVMIELKLAGNHLDRTAVDRAMLRRLARQIQRLYHGQNPVERPVRRHPTAELIQC
jgi:hypothetical protein